LTYSKLFFERDTSRQRVDEFDREVFVASEVETLKFLVVFEVLEDLAHALNIIDFVVLERHLDHVFSFFEITDDLLALPLVNHQVLDNVPHGT